MRKHKGFFIPRADKSRSKPRDADNTRQHACFRCNLDDCDAINMCNSCLFYSYSEGDQKQAFNEWFKAKGEVQYDKAT